MSLTASGLTHRGVQLRPSSNVFPRWREQATVELKVHHVDCGAEAVQICNGKSKLRRACAEHMRRVCLSLAFILIGGLAHADECDEKIRQIVLETGTQFISREPGKLVELQHPLLGEFTLKCSVLGIDAHVNNAFPSTAQLRVLATMGEITTGTRIAEARAALENCHRAAVSDTKSKKIPVGDATISCIVLRDTTQGTTIFSIYPRPPNG